MRGAPSAGRKWVGGTGGGDGADGVGEGDGVGGEESAVIQPRGMRWRSPPLLTCE